MQSPFFPFLFVSNRLSIHQNHCLGECFVLSDGVVTADDVTVCHDDKLACQPTILICV